LDFLSDKRMQIINIFYHNIKEIKLKIFKKQRYNLNNSIFSWKNDEK